MDPLMESALNAAALRPDEEVDPAEQAGYEASVRGAAPWDNPYQPGTLGFSLWDQGWMRQHSEQA